MSLRSLLVAGAAAFAFALPSLAEAQTITTTLNLRGGPSTGHGVIMAMPAGATVTVHQCSAGWCQVSYAGRTGWASQRYIDVRVAAAPRTRVAGPRVGFELHAGVAPRHHWHGWHRPARFAGWHQPHWWHGRPAGWYGPVYWDRNRWWHGGQWHASPGFAFHIGIR
jgi:uncharacterized protein YraI